MGGLGWSPFFNVNGYLLDYKVGNTKQNLSAIAPSVGLAYAARTGGVSFGVGYTWVHNPVITVPGAEGGTSNGVTEALERTTTDPGGARYTHNCSRTITSAAVPLGSRPCVGPTWILRGASGADRPRGRRTGRWQERDHEQLVPGGPTLEYAWTPNFRTTGVIGYKNVGGTFFGASSPRESALTSSSSSHSRRDSRIDMKPKTPGSLRGFFIGGWAVEREESRGGL